MARLVVVGDGAWTVKLLRKQQKFEAGNPVINWEPGQNSAIDTRHIASGRDVGNVIVQRKTAEGLKDEVHDITFAFVFHAFKPQGTIHKSCPPDSEAKP